MPELDLNRGRGLEIGYDPARLDLVGSVAVAEDDNEGFHVIRDDHHFEGDKARLKHLGPLAGAHSDQNPLSAVAENR
jgi:hypothetical protein